MAHVEPMDVDSMESDYEDKENSILHSNVIPKIPCTEKGYEELDASELNMKLRYSITPASSPMSRSYTANCKDNKNIEERNSSCIGNANLTNSFNSTLTNNDINNASKVYPLQTLPTENLNDMNRNVLLPKSIDKEDKNVTITVSNSVDENISIPSTSSSITHTPESTTPTKELPKDGGSPIMRGLRSVLSMFKPQSPGPSHEQGPQEDSGPLQANNTITDESPLHPVEVSTPLRTTNRTSPKRTSPHRDSINFNDDLEKELQWKDDSTILFKEEKIPKHKLFLQESVASNIESKILNKTKEECNGTIEYMDISYNDSALIDKTMTDIETKPHGLEAGGLESDDLPVSTSTDVAKSEDSTKAGNGAENFTDTAQHRKEERKNITFVTCENESYNNLHSAYENEIECKENCVEKIKDLVVNEDAKSENAVYGNSQSNDVDTILPQIEHEITCNENNREIIFEAIDFNLENKILEENNKEMAESLQTINNSSKTLEINVDFCEISQNNKGIDENAESLNEKVKNNNVDKNTKIVISEINKMLPMDVPLPTDSEFDKEIVDFCDANKIPDDLKVNEISESFEINANKDLDKLTYLLETPIEKIGDKTINQQSNSSHCKLDSTLKITDEKCVTVACNKTFDNNYSFEVIEKGQEEGESIVLKSGQSNNITMLNKSNADDIVIDDKPETFSNNSFQPTHDETFQCYTNESKSKNELSSPCDTNSNFENLGVEEFSNIKQLSNPFETKNKIQTSPPLSPVISSKGYNINFDDIEDPFATKIKIRQSPNPETSGHIALISEDNKSRKVSPKVNKSEKRKSYPIRKPMNAKNNSLNATFDCDNKKGCKANVEDSDKIAKNTKKEETIDSFKADTSGLSNTVINSTSKYNLDIKKKSLIDNKIEAIEEGHLFSKPTDPTPVRDITKSVFNCPEINDLNFCSITDKQKTMSSNLTIPSGDITFSDEDCPKANIDSLDSICPEVQGVALVDGETSISKDSKSGDIKEVNTEDEDTATFNETIEFIENDKENPNTEKDLLAFEVSHTALDNENIDNGEMFIDAEAFEFLLNQNQSNVIADSGKESLFLKFDPLFTKRVSSDGIIAALKKVQNNQSTPKKLTKLQLQTPSEMPGPSQKETVDDVIDEASIQAMTKPMMVVNPAINSIVSPRKAATPKVNRQSLTFTSPAMAVIDKLLSLSGSSLVANHNTPVSPVRQHNETDIAITQLREMLADKDIHVHNLKSESKELKDRLSSLEAQVKSLEVESAERLKKVNDLNERLLEKTKINKSMSNVVEEYERTISSLIAQIEQEKKNNAEERIMLIKERDEQTAHLASMEVSFNDLHSKYEKSKQLIYSMKANEETYKKSIQEFEESLTKMQNNYELLKQHATSKLNHANLELERFNRAHESEVLKLNALIKRKELHITSLEETLAQKTKANEELTAICDELINKVG
ncbi:uncharacterized protein LOC121726278 isoform X7 [Aricia agestis]|uniref:uncharacterized protein LOC121726278 isoform X7 n=1 Tax=Aricia agestis TaxID=91739 RepID=UPI001C2023EF|nr:uncharacterized protein LOC121726278 isoform X7 [Aricia agestis]